MGVHLSSERQEKMGGLLVIHYILYAAAHTSRRHRHRHLPRAIPRSLSPARVDPWCVAYMTRSFDPGPCYLCFHGYAATGADKTALDSFILPTPVPGYGPGLFTGTARLPFTSFTSLEFTLLTKTTTSTTSGLTPPRTPARRRCAGLKLPTSDPNIAFGHPEPRGATTKRTTDWMPSATPILHDCSGPGQRRSTTQTCKPWRRDTSP